MKKYFTLWGSRTFVDFHLLLSCIESYLLAHYQHQDVKEKIDDDIVVFGYLYDTYKEADSVCSHISDGGTERVYSVDILDAEFKENKKYYTLAFESTDSKKYRERYIFKNFPPYIFDELFKKDF